MIQLSLETVNKLYIQCSDLVTVASPIYLFRFYNEQTKAESFIEIANESLANQRFDLFSLDLPNDLNLLQGVYLWEVRQSEAEGTPYSTSMPLLSNGLAKVLSIFEENSTYEPTGSDTVYNG